MARRRRGGQGSKPAAPKVVDTTAREVPDVSDAPPPATPVAVVSKAGSDPTPLDPQVVPLLRTGGTGLAAICAVMGGLTGYAQHMTPAGGLLGFLAGATTGAAIGDSLILLPKSQSLVFVSVIILSIGFFSAMGESGIIVAGLISLALSRALAKKESAL